MVETREDAVEQLEKHQETMRLDDFVRIVEEHHGDREPGVERDVLAAYAEAVYFDVDLSAIDDRVMDSDEWVEGKRLYVLGNGRISAYPPDWHEAFSDTDDLLDLVDVIEEQVTKPEGTKREAVTDEGVPMTKLIRVARTVAGIEREAIEDRLTELNREDEITWDSKVHDPRVQLPDETR